MGILVFLMSFYVSFVGMYSESFQISDSSSTTSNWLLETTASLQTFKDKFAFKGSLVMLKKADLSTTVVSSYPFGGHAQVLLAIVSFLLCLHFHQMCSPFKKALYILNYYESFSPLTSSLTFTLGQFFNIEKMRKSSDNKIYRSFVD